jgi:ParB family chromosome partitioning protein
VQRNRLAPRRRLAFGHPLCFKFFYMEVNEKYSQYEWKSMSMEVRDIPVTKITISTLNIRKHLDADHENGTFEDLADSIRENGLLNPITVIQKGDLYELDIGLNRLLACQYIGLKTIPAIVRDDISNADSASERI